MISIDRRAPFVPHSSSGFDFRFQVFGHEISSIPAALIEFTTLHQLRPSYAIVGNFVDEAIGGDPAVRSNLESAVIGGYLP